MRFSRCLQAAVLAALSTSALAEDQPLTFERDIRPILKANCFHCHGEEGQKEGGLDVRLVRLISTGGDSGPAITAGDADASLVWNLIEADEMPKGARKLSKPQKEIIHRWITQGARTARPEPENVADARYTPEELSHWAFQPITKPSVPVLSETSTIDPIDAFLLVRLRERGIGDFSAAADRRVLIRRASYDLTGLPPTPNEVAAFVQSESPAAYEELVDRLIDSPHYGERWGRHWLDVAGYAESDGSTNVDRARPYAWKYRDYVVRSFNADKPFDRFVQEQLAGDELARQPLDLNDPETIELLTATGFLRMAPDGTEDSDNVVDRNQTVAEVIKVVSSSLLGLTMACAQCHDHRYDPISQEDYHRLRAIFDPAFNLQAWKKPSVHVIDATSAEAKRLGAEIDAKVQAQLAEINARRKQRATEIHQLELEKVPASDREPLLTALAAAENARSPEQRSLLERYPAVKTVDFIAGFLTEYDNPAFQKFTQEEAAAKKELESKPPADIRMVVDEAAGILPESRIYFRGDPLQPREIVTPGEPRALCQHRDTGDLPAKNPELPSSGRRLAWAKVLTSGTHPLLSRVIVNRVWKLHFGRGLVDTPGDFGMNGARPSHPELLDWLASQFVEDGWSLKRLHRRIMLTRAYRQQSVRTPLLDQVDADNVLLGRMSVRRLSAEEIRDSLLATSGVLNDELFGPSVPVTIDLDGAGVVGKRTLNSAGKPDGPLERVSAEQERRRSLYLANHRTMPMTLLEAFDMPAMAPNCDVRRCSTVPTQSLIFMNDKTLIERAGELAERLMREAMSEEARIALAHQLLYGVDPTPAELDACRGFMARQADRFRSFEDPGWKETLAKTPDAAERRALASLGQVLYSANRFIYVD